MYCMWCVVEGFRRFGRKSERWFSGALFLFPSLFFFWFMVCYYKMLGMGVWWGGVTPIELNWLIGDEAHVNRCNTYWIELIDWRWGPCIYELRPRAFCRPFFSQFFAPLFKPNRSFLDDSNSEIRGEAKAEARKVYDDCTTSKSCLVSYTIAYRILYKL